MSDVNTPVPLTDRDFEYQRTGEQFGYGHWLQPIITANDASTGECEAADTVATGASRGPTPPRRGRGRPRVSKPRNESAIEKRRAQVREAQRTYQKRKDRATAKGKSRVDEVLQLLSDLSTDVESLLQVASTAGSMSCDDDVWKNIQRLGTTYDTVINNEHILPELRLLQVKNRKRIAAHYAKESSQDAELPDTPAAAQETNDNRILAPPLKTVLPFDPSDINFDLVRFEGTTVMSSYQRSAATDKYMGGRSIFDHVRERQAALKEAYRSQPKS